MIKNDLIFVLSCLFILNSFIKVNAQEIEQAQKYDGLSQTNKKTIFSDNFENNNNAWKPDKKSTGTIKTGQGNLVLESADGKLTTVQNIEINENENFEIETKIKFHSGNAKRAFGLQWGKSNSGDRYFSFVINAKQQFAISKYSGAYINYKQEAKSSLIKINDYNKLTIRKIDNMVYFFLNETLVYSREYKLAYGNYIGFQSAGGNIVRADYLVANYFTAKTNNNPPEIILIEPELDNTFLNIKENQKTLRIKGFIEDEQTINTIKINNKNIPLKNDGSFDTEINIENNIKSIKIQAVDKQLQNSEEYINLIRPVTKQNNPSTNNKLIEGEYYALIIGVGLYENIDDLDMPISDAEKLVQILSENYTFNKKNIVKLKNPKRADLIIALDEISQKVSEDDNLLIFYAGHGYWDFNRKLGYWLPADASMGNTANWFRNSTLKSYIASIDTRNILLISDACFAGGIFKSRGISLKAPGRYADLYNLPCRKAMTSGNLNEVPDKSVFFKYLIKRLTDNTEKFMTAEDLFNSFKKSVINNTNNKPQFGTIKNSGDQGGGFIFIRK